MPELSEWDSFYVIVASAAGALIGLQFVVLTLLADSPKKRAPAAGSAFATPTIVHFSTALLISALTRAPWRSITSIAVLWGIIGLSGIAYSLIVARRMRRQPVYRPDLEDWLCHAALPMAAYVILTLSAYAANRHVWEALFGVGAATLLLLFIGIHNTWDALTFHVFVSLPKEKDTVQLPAGKAGKDD